MRASMCLPAGKLEAAYVRTDLSMCARFQVRIRMRACARERARYLSQHARTNVLNVSKPCARANEHEQLRGCSSIASAAARCMRAGRWPFALPTSWRPPSSQLPSSPLPSSQLPSSFASSVSPSSAPAHIQRRAARTQLCHSLRNAEARRQATQQETGGSTTGRKGASSSLSSSESRSTYSCTRGAAIYARA